ncbi:hypothetical protein WJX81_005988 [Elliptochloris bilobata]|uniref:Uncharacterized protein n=1 Tax=Elliptochloris bilobata TaxID=381761 RepID=A0AAW1S8Y1_9CHLO
MDNVVVLDYGSQTFKAGLATNFPNAEEPRVVTPSAVELGSSGRGALDSVNDHAASASASQDVVDRGVVTHWEGFESMCYDILYRQLGWEQGDEGSLLVAEPLFTSKADQERLTQLFFEQFNVNALFLCDQAVLSLYALGKTSGTVIDLGHGKVDIALVEEGRVHQPASRRLPFGGRDLTQHLARLLHLGAGGAALLRAQVEALERAKIGCMRVLDSKEELAAASAQEPGAYAPRFTLPDGRSVALAREGVALGEALVDPSALGLDLPPVAEAAFSAIMGHHDSAQRKAALDSVLVCGGGSAAPGAPQRVLRDLRSLAPPSITPAPVVLPEYMPPATPRHAAWMGGAVLSKVVFQGGHAIGKFDYDEIGPGVVHRKCC